MGTTAGSDRPFRVFAARGRPGGIPGRCLYTHGLFVSGRRTARCGSIYKKSGRGRDYRIEGALRSSGCIHLFSETGLGSGRSPRLRRFQRPEEARGADRRGAGTARGDLVEKRGCFARSARGGDLFAETQRFGVFIGHHQAWSFGGTGGEELGRRRAIFKRRTARDLHSD